jgi:biotin-(acetyl-CoA carboxylase) ligase
VIAAWKEYARMLGRRVTVTLGGPKGPGQKAETITGVAEDLDLDGMLVVRGEDGSVVRVVAGEVAL